MLSTSQTFTWNNGAGPVAYDLLLGTTGKGSTDLCNLEGPQGYFDFGLNSGSNGVTVYAMLRQLINGNGRRPTLHVAYSNQNAVLLA